MAKLMKGVNDLATLHPDLSEEWHPVKNGNLKPSDVTCGKNTKVWWIGKCGHEWEALISSRARGRGCPACTGRVAVAGFNDLESQFPDIAKTWDYELNSGILPSQVMSHSNKKFYWRCDKGHSYKAVVENRVNGSGCTYCAGKAVLKGFNDFESNYPELAKEWDYEANDILPSEITIRSRKKYHWICSKCGYKWTSTVAGRSGRGYGCPKCANNIAITGHNDLYSLRPDLIKEWNYEKNTNINPKKIAVNSHKKVWWKCKLGHEWQSSVENRSFNHTGCPECTGYLRTSFPEQAIFYYIGQHFNCTNSKIMEQKEIDIYIESMRVGIEYDGMSWHQDVSKDIKKNMLCSKNNIRLLRVREKGCPELTDCEYYEVVPGKYSDLELAISWIFKKLGLDEPDVNIERDRNHIISNYENNRGDRSLASKYPELLLEWNYEKNHPLTPEMVTYGSQKKVWWKCSNHHEYEASVCNRAKGTSCPYCSGKKVFPGLNDLCTTHPDVAKDWDYDKNINLNPHELSHSSSLKVWWKCEKGHEWKACIVSRCNHNGKCKICNNYERSHKKGSHTLSSMFPELLSEWDYELNTEYTPETIAARSNKKMWWKCSKGHSYRMTVANRTYGNKCPICKMKSVRNIDTGEVFKSITAAAEKYKCDKTIISRCAHGKQKTASGCRWEFTD